MNARTVHADFANDQGQPRNGGEFEIGVQVVEGHKLAASVWLTDDEIADIGGHGEGIDANFSDTDLSVEGGGNLFNKHVAGDARQKKKSDCGIKGYATDRHDQGFLPPGQIFPSFAYSHHVALHFLKRIQAHAGFWQGPGWNVGLFGVADLTGV